MIMEKFVAIGQTGADVYGLLFTKIRTPVFVQKFYVR